MYREIQVSTIWRAPPARSRRRRAPRRAWPGRGYLLIVYIYIYIYTFIMLITCVKNHNGTTTTTTTTTANKLL